MSKRNHNEYGQNPNIRRGLVVDRDPKAMRVKVQFQDEDDLVTQWIDVVAKSSTGVSAFQMPGEKDEVWCAMDAKGEAGCLIGSRYNAKDAPSGSTNDQVVITFAGGFIQLDTGTGNMAVRTPGSVDIQSAGSFTVTAASGHLA